MKADGKRKPRRIAYSAPEMAWLEANRAMIIGDYHRAFQAAFGRGDVSAANLHGLRKRMGWKVGRAPGRFTGRHSRYAPPEIAWLRDHCGLSLKDCHAAFCAAFGRADVTAAMLHSLRKRLKLKTGRSGQFVKGQTPPNKGKKRPYNAASAATQFKNGQLPHNTKYLGHEYIVDGYINISVAETNPHTGYERRYVHKHRHLWEAKNGPVPDGMVLKCLDGNRLNTDPSNWEPVPRAVLSILNGGPHKRGISYDAAHPELKPTVMALAKLKHRAGAARRSGHDR
jgi:hypothetical protein